MTLDEAQLVRLDRAEAVAQEIYHYSQFDAPHCSQRSKNRSVICAETMIRYTTNELHLRLERIAEQDEEIRRLQFENKTIREALVHIVHADGCSHCEWCAACGYGTAIVKGDAQKVLAAVDEEKK